MAGANRGEPMPDADASEAACAVRLSRRVAVGAKVAHPISRDRPGSGGTELSCSLIK